MNVYLIEDDLKFAKQLSKTIKDALKNKKTWETLNIVHVKSDYFRFISSLEKEALDRSVFIFDIELSNCKQTGLSLAKQLRNFDFESYIIFLTSHIEMTAMTYQYNLKALNFIYKGNPNFEQVLIQAFDQIDYEMKNWRGKANVKSNGDLDTPRLKYAYQSNYYNIKLRDILFIETHGLKRKLIIHTAEGKYEHPGPLKTLKESLGCQFVQTHRTTLAQANQIEYIAFEEGGYIAYFNRSNKCMVSKKYLKSVTEAMGLLQA